MQLANTADTSRNAKKIELGRLLQDIAQVYFRVVHNFVGFVNNFFVDVLGNCFDNCCCSNNIMWFSIICLELWDCGYVKLFYSRIICW